MPLNLQNFFKPGADPEALKSTLAERLHEHDERRFNDPQSNAIELLAYDL